MPKLSPLCVADQDWRSPTLPTPVRVGVVRRRSWLATAAASLCLAGLLGLLTACRSTTVHSRFSPKAEFVPRGATLAVVPFENLSSSRNAGLAATDLAISILFAQDYFQVFDVGILQDDPEIRFRRLEITPWEREMGANPSAAATVGRAQNTDYVLAGSVGEYGFIDGFGETATVGISVRLARSTTGEVIWSASLSRRVASVAFSEESAHQLTQQVLSDLFDLLLTDLQAQAAPPSLTDDLSPALE